MTVEIVSEYCLLLIVVCFTLCFIAFTAFLTSCVAQILMAGFRDWMEARKKAIRARGET
jgi:hypothetical protein